MTTIHRPHRAKFSDTCRTARQQPCLKPFVQTKYQDQDQALYSVWYNITYRASNHPVLPSHKSGSSHWKITYFKGLHKCLQKPQRISENKGNQPINQLICCQCSKVNKLPLSWYCSVRSLQLKCFNTHHFEHYNHSEYIRTQEVLRRKYCQAVVCLAKMCGIPYRPGVSSMKGQGHFHFAKDTSFQGHFYYSLALSKENLRVNFWRGTKAKTRGNRGHCLSDLCVICAVLSYMKCASWSCGLGSDRRTVKRCQIETDLWIMVPDVNVAVVQAS